MSIEQRAAELLEILSELERIPAGRAAIADIRALEVAFVRLRLGGSSTDVERREQALAQRLRRSGLEQPARRLDAWLGRILGVRTTTVEQPRREAPQYEPEPQPLQPEPQPRPRLEPEPEPQPEPLQPQSHVQARPRLEPSAQSEPQSEPRLEPSPPQPQPSPQPQPQAMTRDLLILPQVLPSRATLNAFAGEWAVVLAFGGDGAMCEHGEGPTRERCEGPTRERVPCQFNGNASGPALEQFFADLLASGVRARCLVLDFQFSLAWLDRLLPLLAPGGVAIACWSSAKGELAQTVLGGARAPADIAVGASELLRSRNPDRWFDSPHALLVGDRGVRGASALYFVLLDPTTADSNLAGSNAVLRWIAGRLVGCAGPIRSLETRLGLSEFEAAVRALVG